MPSLTYLRDQHTAKKKLLKIKLLKHLLSSIIYYTLRRNLL